MKRIKETLCQLLKVLEQLQNLEILHNNIRVSSLFVIESNDEWKISLGEFDLAHFMKDIHRTKIDEKEKFYLAP